MSVSTLQARTGAEEMIISTGKITEPRMQEIVAMCAAAGLPVRMMKIEFRPVVSTVEGWMGISPPEMARGRQAEPKTAIVRAESGH